MRFSFLRLRNQYANVYKIFLLVLSVILLVALFPRAGTFKYEFQKGKYWKHDDLIAPFDFAISKTDEELNAEKADLLNNTKLYFRAEFTQTIQKRQNLSDLISKKCRELKCSIKPSALLSIYDTLINTGIIELVPEIENRADDFSIILLKNNIAEEKELGKFYTIKTADNYIKNSISLLNPVNADVFRALIEDALIQNVKFDSYTTEKEKQHFLSAISPAKGMVENGQSIISKGELITADKFQILQSLKNEYETQLGTSSGYYLVLLGQILLLTISITVLVLFMRAFRKQVLADNKNLLFILLLIYMMVFITSLVTKTDSSYIYMVPICLVAVIVRVFFDTRLALFVHLVCISIIGFLVPNSFDFVFIQLLTGIVTIISVANLEKRAQFFMTSLYIFITYSALYIGLLLIQNGNIPKESLRVFVMFAASAMLTLFTYPLIFLFEKLFGFVTDVSLMELTNTNSKLLRELAVKTPGTFQHSMQIANLVEEVIFEIGGNALLARAGAMYHDIGKIEMPMYFIENQNTVFNPHSELSCDESAEIIISHVSKGIKIARKHNIPEQIIDFIRTHHGTRRTDFFFQQFKTEFPEEIVNEATYTYKGPIPYSKETAVLMMVDSVEAASRSLKTHDEASIDELVENIINEQIEGKQFVNSNITFRDIDKIKNILKKKLINIYHIRVEYPAV